MVDGNLKRVLVSEVGDGDVSTSLQQGANNLEQENASMYHG